MANGMRVGRLAEQTGLSIRTFHYYDEIGLLKPSDRTESGHRLYTDADVARLQQIVSLRALDFTLEEIAECLDDPGFDLRTIVRMHRIRLKRELDRTQVLHDRLEALEEHLRRAEDISVDEFIKTIEGITMIDKYFTQEQLDELEQRRLQVGEERIREVEREWEEIFATIKEMVARGVDPASNEAQELVVRMDGLIGEFTGGNPEIRQSLTTMYEQEGPEKASRGMMDPAIWDFMAKAKEARKG